VLADELRGADPDWEFKREEALPAGRPVVAERCPRRRSWKNLVEQLAIGLSLVAPGAGRLTRVVE